MKEEAPVQKVTVEHGQSKISRAGDPTKHAFSNKYPPDSDAVATRSKRTMAVPNLIRMRYAGVMQSEIGVHDSWGDPCQHWSSRSRRSARHENRFELSVERQIKSATP
jgi:hypothetical protein